MSKKGLSRGLEYLIEQNLNNNTSKEDNQEITLIKISDIKPNPFQPRKTFDQDKLNELAESIKENGLFQPILVRKALVGYEIISGERRFRASKIAGLKEVPVIVYDYDDQKMMEVAIVENIQREDLSVVEEAISYNELMKKLNYTQEQVAQKVGKSRSYIANYLRLLKLDDNILELINNQKITMGHVKTLITLDDKKQIKEIVNKIIDENLSVREVEKIAKELKEPKTIKNNKKIIVNNSRNKRLEKEIREKLNLYVKIKGENKGILEIKFNNEDDLERILEALNIF